MACFGPLTAYFGREVNPKTGKRGIVFSPALSHDRRPFKVPCQQCRGCRLQKAGEWAARCMHEAMSHAENCFINLTYRNDDLPEWGSLVKTHPSAFCKRLHNRLLRKRGYGIKYYLSGEYGESTHRPHYHVCLFGYDFPDKIFYGNSGSGFPIYTSEMCDEIWGLGECKIGAMSYDSACYTAKYTFGKRTGPMADYSCVSPDGEIYDMVPEFSTPSRRPGIGMAYFREHGRSAYDHDFIVVNGKKMKPPRYYDNLMCAVDPDLMDEVKDIRREKALAIPPEENTSRRLWVREQVQIRKDALFKRDKS